MNCRVCDRPLVHLLTFENMPASAQYLSLTPEERTVTLNLCQCSFCGLVQLDNEPVWYWAEEIRTASDKMNARTAEHEGYNFVSYNHLEHRPDINEYLSQFTGTGIIEVPNGNMIFEKNLFAEIMLDHLYYFTEDTLRFTLQHNGFEVLEITRVWHDYILSAKVRRRRPLKLGFLRNQLKLQKSLDDYISRYETVAIYGAGHQAFAYIALLHPRVAFIVDNAPFKQGKYSPVGGLPILPPTALDHADAVVIMAGSYSDEIAETLEFCGGVAIMRDYGIEVIR